VVAPGPLALRCGPHQHGRVDETNGGREVVDPRGDPGTDDGRPAPPCTEDVTSDERLAFLEGLDDAVYLLDDAWRFTYLNAKAERLVRRSRDELLGCSVWDEFPEAAVSELRPLYERARETGERLLLEAYDYPPLDTTFEIHVHPGDRGLGVQFRDVSDHVDRERDLARQADRDQRTAERLRELDDTKNAFLSAVSHELRSPLTIVRGLARELVTSRGSELEDDERHEIEDTILEQAERLEELLSDLLDVDRLKRGALRSRQHECDLAEVVTDAVRSANGLGDRVELDVPDRLPARADASQVERIVVNLLQNAGKYAPSGPVLVRLEPLDGCGGRLEVVDEGPGIPEAERERIFEPLYRIDDDHGRPGTGIGLSLVAAFAQLHGGEARALPSENGAHLQVDLPCPVSEDAGR
jgi:signal transduction histidine kinase